MIREPGYLGEGVLEVRVRELDKWKQNANRTQTDQTYVSQLK